MPAFPEVPTLSELGFTDFDVRDWQGLVAPSMTPKHILERIAADVGKVLEQPEVKERLAAVGVEPVADSSPNAFGALTRAELARWIKVVREAGIHAD
jgi:tripartite-type tricarboxylate transporter receptor subunit TctC